MTLYYDKFLRLFQHHRWGLAATLSASVRNTASAMLSIYSLAQCISSRKIRICSATSLLAIPFFFFQCQQEKTKPINVEYAVLQHEYQLNCPNASDCTAQLLELCHLGLLLEKWSEAAQYLSDLKSYLSTSAGVFPQEQTEITTNTLEGAVAYIEARLLFQNLDFNAAFRQLWVAKNKLLAANTPVSQNFLIQTYHLLSESHFEHARHMDSIGYYQLRAHRLIQPEMFPVIHAQNQLYKAFYEYYRFGWEGIKDYSEAGRQILDNYSDSLFIELRAKTDLIEHYSWAKIAAKFREDSLSRSNLRDSAFARIMSAQNYFEAAGSPWYRKAVMDEFLHELKGNINNAEAVALHLDSTDYLPAADFFGMPDRIKARLAGKREQTDSVIFHFENLLKKSVYNQHRMDEATWFLYTNYKKQGDFDNAFKYMKMAMGLFGCSLHPYDNIEELEQQLSAPTLDNCHYNWQQIADIYLARFQNPNHSQDLTDLEYAYTFIRHALNVYRLDLSTNNDQQAINEIKDLSFRVINSAIRIGDAYEKQYLNGMGTELIYLAQQLGRSSLLLRDLKNRNSNFGRSYQDQLAIADITSRTLIIIEDEIATSDSPEQLAQLRQEQLQLQHDLRQQNINLEYFRSQTAQEEQVPSILTVQRQVKKGQAVITFSKAGNSLYWTYIDNKNVHYESIPDAQLLFTQTVQVTEILGKKYLDLQQEDFRLFYKNVYQIEQALFNPIRQLLKNNEIREILISPDDVLSALPFSCLTSSHFQHDIKSDQIPEYLGQQYNLMYYSSWQIEQLKQIHRQDFSERDRLGIWTSERISKTLGNTDRHNLGLFNSSTDDHYIDADCTSESFINSAGKYDIVHLSMHARSGHGAEDFGLLFFSTTDSLQVPDLNQLDLDSVRLFFLAACETEDGQPALGEGILSISRTLRARGATDVVSTLWRVDKESTAYISKQFYEALLGPEHLSPAAALRRAQRACFTRPGYPDWKWPGFWAGLVVG